MVILDPEDECGIRQKWSLFFLFYSKLLLVISTSSFLKPLNVQDSGVYCCSVNAVYWQLNYTEFVLERVDGDTYQGDGPVSNN